MRQIVSLSIAFLLLFSWTSPALPRADYFSEEELDLIRDAQELKARLPVYFRLAEKRLIVLGVSEKSAKELENERKRQEQYEKDRKKAGDKADKVPKPVSEYDDLLDYTRSQLLLGYQQAIEEVMTNLEDAYSRRLEIREPLESFEKFLSETAPKVEKYSPRNEAETLARESALEKALEAQEGAKEALLTIPKTEKKSEKSK